MLRQQHCVACREDSPRLTDQELSQLASEIPDWKIVEPAGEKMLERVFKFPDFAQALEFTERVGELAEAEDHHPRLVTEWGKVTVDWWTHKIHGLHRNDAIMAARTDQVYQEMTGKGDDEGKLGSEPIKKAAPVESRHKQ